VVPPTAARLHALDKARKQCRFVHRLVLLGS
jgi:hypothetical protein